MEKEKPQVTIDLECPVLHKKEEVTFDVNVFHGAEHGGLDVAACSEFGNGEVTCGKDCIHTTPQAHRLHEEEIRKHQHELAKIGPNVIP